MPFDLAIGRPRDQLRRTLNVGQHLFILGANGTGKSALIQNLYRQHMGHAVRIAAHRQTWFSSGANSMSSLDRRNMGSNLLNFDAQVQARWKEQWAEQRASLAIYDLMEAENVQARAIASILRAGDVDSAKKLAASGSPLEKINDLLRSSHLDITLSIRDNIDVMASKAGSAPYSVAELSDGERAAVLIASVVLTARPDTLLLVDEPERHLHRAIVSPLLTQLFTLRPDCAFIVSTHDVALCMDHYGAEVLLVRSTEFVHDQAALWDIDVLPPGAPIDEDLKEAILGSRRKVLFVEGTERSLDKSLYAVLFPGVSVVAKGGSRDVENAVAGIRGANDLVWLHAFGLIDNDGRPAEVVAELRERRIYALPIHSVESIYYHADVQRRVAANFAGVTGANADTALAEARNASIAAIRPQARRQSARVIEKALIDEVTREIPGQDEIEEGVPIEIDIDVKAKLDAEEARLVAYLDANDLQAVVDRYPIRETPALDTIARRLGFQGRSQYESSVRTLLKKDPDALLAVRTLLGTLATDVLA